MFLTDLEDFDHKPYVKDGEIVRGKVVTQSIELWESDPCGRPEGVEAQTTVPSGFVNDLASIPWLVMWLLRKLGKTQRPAVLHDWLTRNQIGTFYWAAMQFNAAMKQDGVSNARRRAAVAGVLAGGYPSWKWPREVVIVE